MRRDSITLQQLDDRGHDVRAWCWACARGTVIDTIVWQRFAARGWPQDLTAAAARFTCRQCGAADDVALYPARRAPAPANAGSLLVEHWFHNMRSIGKTRRNEPGIEAASAHLLASLEQDRQARQDVKRRVPTKRPNLRIVGTRQE